eukprot:3975214-Prymnesium_polylepis.1
MTTLTQHGQTLGMFNGSSAGNPPQHLSGVSSRDRALVKQALTSPGLALAISLWSGDMSWMQGDCSAYGYCDLSSTTAIFSQFSVNGAKPSPPSPTPGPSPSPTPSSCPGGDLATCISQCPTAHFQSCVAECIADCPNVEAATDDVSLPHLALSTHGDVVEVERVHPASLSNLSAVNGGCYEGTLAACVAHCPTPPVPCGVCHYRNGARSTDPLICRHDDQPGGPHVCYPVPKDFGVPCDSDMTLCTQNSSTVVSAPHIHNWCLQSCFLDCPK